LQYGPVKGPVNEVAERLGITVLHCDAVDCSADLDGLAALMVVCDEVVSIGNATAHLAGALGLPVKVLLPYVAPWRWMAEGERCVWYPSARLIRQRERGQWNSVIEEAALKLGCSSQ
jgi:ADP-heptose:LPS heptosyltransferase